KQASAVAESLDGVEDIMHRMSLRRGTRGCIGIGENPGAIRPDGIEKKITDLSKKELSKERLTKEAGAIERMAYIAAAIAEVTKNKPLERGPKEKKEIWRESADGTRKFALELATAAKKRDASAIHRPPVKLDANCTKCNNLFVPPIPELIVTLQDKN